MSNNLEAGLQQLNSGGIPILIATPNGREESGTSRDCLLLNPYISASSQVNLIKDGMFKGILVNYRVKILLSGN